MNVDKNDLDYNQTVAYFHALHDVRFKLLALIPVLSGLAFVTVSKATPEIEIFTGIFGAVVTFGLTLYDQRNTMIYDQLIRRAKFLEAELGFNKISVEGNGGAFTDRPERRTLFGIPFIWHDLGLSLVYSASISSWSFLIIDGFFKVAERSNSIQIKKHILWLFPLTVFITYLSWLIVLARKNDKNIEFLGGSEFLKK